jgi:pyruvyltransferase
VERQPRAVVEDIARCEYVASSSLHGVIVAHALGVPALWLRISDQLKGGAFKFRDYASALNMQLATLDLCQELTSESIIAAATLPDATILKSRQRALHSLFSKIAQEFKT